MNERLNDRADRLYELLPAVYRVRDAEQGYPLQALLRVISEQVNLVEDDIAQLYEDWFIETCRDWVVPYIGDLIGYQPVHEAGEPSTAATAQGLSRNKILIPRREVANTIQSRRRRGTLALLEELSRDSAGWPAARVVEFYRLLGVTRRLHQTRLGRRTVDLRQGDALDRLDGPFDALPHTVDVRSIASGHTVGRYNIPNVGVFVWRLKTYSVTRAPATCLEDIGPHFYAFSVLGNDTPLYTRSRPETDESHVAGEMNLPVPIRRRAFLEHKNRYYGEGKSLQIWTGVARQAEIDLEPVRAERIVPADLSQWSYEPHGSQVAVDPVLGRIAFPPDQRPDGVWVSYFYGFRADIGGGEYDRPLLQPGARVVQPDAPPVEPIFYRVGEREEL
ncbi:MAG TPA: hypothetical protein VNA16_00185, partial [Abditibacteriaceae bacterium]|nr:hypothetical protein [Abditibacteriaceae bacterium]